MAVLWLLWPCFYLMEKKQPSKSWLSGCGYYKLSKGYTLINSNFDIHPTPSLPLPPPNLQASPGIWTFTDKNASDTIAFCGIFCHFSVEDSLKHNKMYHFQIEYSSRQLKAKQKYWLGKKHSTSFINKNEHTSEWWGFERHCTHW